MTPKTYTFSKPIFSLFLLPVLAVLAFLVMGLIREFNLFVLVMILITVLILYGFAGLSFLRKIHLNPEGLKWSSPRRSMEMEWSEVKHIGVIKFRSFRFIYLSSSEENPWKDPNRPVVSDDDTFLFQFRKEGWNKIREQLPHLAPADVKRG